MSKPISKSWVSIEKRITRPDHRSEDEARAKRWAEKNEKSFYLKVHQGGIPRSLMESFGLLLDLPEDLPEDANAPKQVKRYVSKYTEGNNGDK